MQKTRKLIAMLLAVMMVLSMCTVGMFSASALPEDAVISDTEGNDASSIDGELYGLMGDSDSNGKINVKDATQIQKFAAKLIELDETSAALADVDLNGKVNVKDATAIQKWVAKIPVDAPINCLVYIPTAEPTTVATEPTTIVVVPTTAATEDETVPVIIPTLVTEPTEAPTTVEPTEAPTTVEPTEAPTTEAKPTEAPTTEAKPTEAPTTEAKPTEAPTTVKPTDAPEGDVIVYFQNNWMWSNVCAYAWNDDGAISKWPGEAMTFVENDGNYDIYSYVVPAGAKGILFNGTKDTDPTTRDQTPNIEEWTNGQCFYMVWDETANEGEGGNGVGSFPYVAPTEPATETTLAPETTVASDTDPTETTAADTKPTETTEATTVAPETIGAGYYLVGIIGGEELWDADTLTADRKFKANPDVAGDYVLYWTTIGGDEYKVAYFDGTAITKLFKAEGEDNYKIGKTSDKIGYCKIDFNPEGKSTSVWSYKYFTVKTTTPPVTQPTDAPETQATTVAPESKPQLTESDYELRGSFNDWNGQAMYIAEEDGVVTLTLELAAGEYTFKIKKGDTWYGNDGKIEDTTKKTSQGGWEMSSSAGDCTLIASGGTYTFNFNTSTKKLNVLYSTEPVTEPTEAPTTVAPETSTAAPETSTAAPETSTAAPETSTAAPETSTAAPETSTVAPETSTVAPETSTVAPETSTVAPETDPTETTTEADGLEAGYYLVGIIDGKECWKADTLVAERKFKTNPDVAGDYVLYWTTVMDDEYKVAYFDGTEITKLFKAEGEPNYTIGTEKKVGYCKIDFNPDGKDTSVWSYKYFTVNATEAPETEPTETTTVAPETETTTVAPETETTEPTTPDVETVVITFNAANTTWVSSAGAKLVLVDNDTNKEYPMTGSGNVWTVEVPVTVTNITFNRNDPSTNKPWNFWVAGDRADAVKYNTLGDGAGSWEGVAAPEWYVRGSFNSWGTANPMKTTDGVTYTCEITLAIGNYEFKVGNVDWSSSYPGSNKSLNVTTAGTYLFTFNASSKTVTAVLK